MANNHSIKVLNLEILKNHNNKKNVVQKVTFLIKATNGNSSESIVKNQEFDTSSLTNFTDFENLTEEQVIGWIVDAVGDKQIQEWNQEADKMLENLLAPNQVFVNPPWLNK